MTRQIYIAGNDLAYRVRFPNDIGVVEGADGTVEVGKIIVEDPDKTATFKNLNAAYIVETAASPQRVWTGYIFNIVESRGNFRAGVSRILTCDTMDQNRNLVIRPVLSKNGYRPAETDLDRLTWLLGNPCLDGLVYQGGYTNLTDNAILLDEADYRDQTAAQILGDFAPIAGKRFFAYYNANTDKIELFYDLADAAINTSGSQISNVIADAGADVYYPSEDSEWELSGEQIFSGVDLVYKGTGRVVAYNDTTKATYGEAVYVYQTSRIGKLETANTVAVQFVTDHNKPDEILRTTIEVPPANLNDIRAGQRLQVKYSHFTDLDSFTYLRVTKREVNMHESGNYLVGLEATNRVRKSIGGGVGTGVVPPPAATSASIVQTGCGFNLGSTVTLTFPSPITAGNMLVAWIVSRGASSDVGPPDGSWTTAEHVDLQASGANPYNSPAAIFYKVADATEAGHTTLSFLSTNGSSRPKILGWELAGVALPTSMVQATRQSGTSGSLPALTTTAGNGIAIAGISFGTDNPSPYTLTPNDHIYFEGGDGFWATALGADKVPTASSTTFSTSFAVSGGSAIWAGAAIYFPNGTDTSQPPTQGQPWGPVSPNETPNGSTTSFTMPSGYTWAYGTLKVLVDRLDQTAAVTAQNGSAGTFTLGFAPKTGELVEVFGTEA